MGLRWSLRPPHLAVQFPTCHMRPRSKNIGSWPRNWKTQHWRCQRRHRDPLGKLFCTSRRYSTSLVLAPSRFIAVSCPRPAHRSATRHRDGSKSFAPATWSAKARHFALSHSLLAPRTCSRLRLLLLNGILVYDLQAARSKNAPVATWRTTETVQIQATSGPQNLPNIVLYRDAKRKKRQSEPTSCYVLIWFGTKRPPVQIRPPRLTHVLCDT
jgi:hypothetical protein